MGLKETIVSDLHKLLFAVDFESDSDNFELNIALAKALLHHHHIYFKEKKEVPDSVYWGSDKDDVAEYFFTTVCPGIVPTVTQFESVCNAFIDWKMWQILHAAMDDAADIEAAVARLKAAMATPPAHTESAPANNAMQDTKSKAVPAGKKLPLSNDSDLKPAA